MVRNRSTESSGLETVSEPFNVGGFVFKNTITWTGAAPTFLSTADVIAIVIDDVILFKGRHLATGDANGTVYLYSVAERLSVPRADENARLKSTIRDIELSSEELIADPTTA